jgi:hypothetical protein
LPGDTEENHGIPQSVYWASFIPAEIRTGYLPSTSIERYLHKNLVDSLASAKSKVWILFPDPKLISFLTCVNFGTYLRMRNDKIIANGDLERTSTLILK